MALKDSSAVGTAQSDSAPIHNSEKSISGYTLTLTEEQARVLTQATETLARLWMGQFSDALEHLPIREFLPDGWRDDMDSIGRMLSRHMIGGIDGYRSSLGIRHKDVAEASRIAWDLYQVMRHRLAWDRAAAAGIIESANAPRKWPEMMQVYYDEPMKVSDQPLAMVRHKFQDAIRDEPEYDLSKCPQCGGDADRGFSRRIPPSTYLCSKCESGERKT